MVTVLAVEVMFITEDVSEINLNCALPLSIEENIVTLPAYVAIVFIFESPFPEDNVELSVNVIVVPSMVVATIIFSYDSNM